MPWLEFGTGRAQCERGVNLRRALLDAGFPLYNGAARWTNCRGLGTCGTCAVLLEGPDGVTPPTRVEHWRLSTPPHRPDRGLRLACQCAVEGDLVVRKGDGLWGQRPPGSTTRREGG